MRFGLPVCLSFVFFTFGLTSLAVADVIISTNTTIDEPIPLTAGWLQIVDGVAPPTVVDIVEGASIEGRLFARGQSIVNIRDGEISGYVVARDSATINIFGGIAASDEDVESYDTSTINIYGGAFGDDIEAEGNSVINVYGGEFRGTFGVQNNGQINVFLREFQILPPDGISPLDRLVGTLADGSAIEVTVWIDQSNLGTGAIHFHAVPEATSLMLAGSAGAFLIALATWKRPNRSLGNHRRNESDNQL